MEILIVNDGEVLRGYDCRDVLRIEETGGNGDSRFLVRFGRGARRREIFCRDVVGCAEISVRDIRPLPQVLKDRVDGDAPWAVGVTDRGLCLLY